MTNGPTNDSRRIQPGDSRAAKTALTNDRILASLHRRRRRRRCHRRLRLRRLARCDSAFSRLNKSLPSRPRGRTRRVTVVYPECSHSLRESLASILIKARSVPVRQEYPAVLSACHVRRRQRILRHHFYRSPSNFGSKTAFYLLSDLTFFFRIAFPP